MSSLGFGASCTVRAVWARLLFVIVALAAASGVAVLPTTGAQAAGDSIGFYGSHGYEMNTSRNRSAGRARSSESRAARPARVSRNSSSGSSSWSAPKSSGGVTWVASGGCLPGSLKSVIAEASRYGRVVVSSTYRSSGRNRSVGGASKSYHLNCQAADFRVHGANVGALASFLRNHGSVGGFHHYGGGLFHIDSGPKRSW